VLDFLMKILQNCLKGRCMSFKVLAFFFILYSSWGTVFADGGKDRSLDFKIPIVAGANNYIEFLSSPAYLLVALQNNGINPSNQGRAVLVDSKTVRMNMLELKYLETIGATYFFNVDLTWESPIKTFVFHIPVEIDTDEILAGSITARFFVPFASYFPEEFVTRLRNRIAFFSASELQHRLIDYLDNLRTTVEPGLGFFGLREALLLQSFSISPHLSATPDAVISEPGDSVPLKEQLALIVTIVIWLVMVPLYLVRRTWKLHKK
jgi:hypothetical protein